MPGCRAELLLLVKYLCLSAKGSGVDFLVEFFGLGVVEDLGLCVVQGS